MKRMIAYVLLTGAVAAVAAEVRSPRTAAQEVSSGSLTQSATTTPYADQAVPVSTGMVALSTPPAGGAAMVVDDREPGPPTETSPRQENTPDVPSAKLGVPSDADKRRSMEIRDALHKELPGIRGLKTEFRDGRLTLRGIAPSEQQKDDAETRAAELIGAGASVDNQIIVK